MTHLGHILSENLDDSADSADIIRETRHLLRKANYTLCTISFADPFVLCSLIKSFCLSLYRAQLWDLSNKNIINLQVVFNRILRRIWNLPFNSHTNIVYCVIHIVSIKNLIVKRFILLYQRALSCSSLVRNVFSFSSSLLYTFVGYNLTSHVTEYSETDIYIANCIRLVRLNFGNFSVFEDYNFHCVASAVFFLFSLFFFAPSFGVCFNNWASAASPY